MGKSSSGKDTIYKRLMADTALSLCPIIPGTTRPIREGETPGVEYHFYTEEELAALMEQGKVIELRSYHTVHGIWNYFTLEEQIDLAHHHYLMIGTLEAYRKMQEYFGAQVMVPIYIEVEDGLRLYRALERERAQAEPKYAELCRRFLADEQDFSRENLADAGISTVFSNVVLEETMAQVTAYIKAQLGHEV
jgi:guanylate kinase